MRTSNELRELFLGYFNGYGHEVVSSSPLVPGNDPTLLFTNAGMVQFKDVFLGQETRPYVRATSSQRCVRAGGKHNDLENVGYTARHHTFFEMLGNFSFGDYFKREAIGYAWEFLTKTLGLGPERLWVTVFEEDDEAAGIWLDEIRVDPARFSRCGAKDNYWSMGETGPCGPCSEIFFDHGPSVAGGPPGSPDQEGDRYVEIWNLVFMQFDRDAAGHMTPLPKPSVDTGMGLERLAAVMQGVHSNYDTDLFRTLIAAAASVTGVDDDTDKSLRVIADHIRSCAFLIADGVLPSNEGRGYVLRRIIRRAVRHGHRAGAREPFFHKLVQPLQAQMGDAYPELAQHRGMIERVLEMEEVRFEETLDHGLRVLDQAVEDLSGDTIPGETVFRLYDTYGFPVDLTADVARERGLQVDLPGFEQAMAEQRERARAASRFGMVSVEGLDAECDTQFVGYDHTEQAAQVAVLFVDGQRVDKIRAGQSGLVVLDRTPFYAESGGQVGDKGVLETAATRFEVTDTQRQGELHTHLGMLQAGELQVGDSVVARIDADARRSTARNHTATHLVHAALRQALGSHVTQKGSLVAPDRLRFDFSHFEPVSPQQLQAIERAVNEWVLDNCEVSTATMPIAEALESGAMALFGEKYDALVRVLKVGEYSTELCGGTHVHRSGDIGLFKLTAEGGVAAGVRRIEALTGEGALGWVTTASERLMRLASRLKVEPESLEEKLAGVLERVREQDKALESLKSKLATSRGGELAAEAVDVDGLKVLAAKLEGADRNTLREAVDQLKQKLGAAAVVLAAVEGGKVSLVAGVTKADTGRLKAGALVNHVAEQVGGRGGGRPDMAEAGGKDPAGLDRALQGVADWVRGQLHA